MKTREDRKRKLEKFQVVMLESDQQEEFEELYHRGFRHECSDALWLSWLPLKIKAEKDETVEIVCEVDLDVVADLQVGNGVHQAKVPSNLPKKTTEGNVRKPDQNNYTNVKRKSSDQSQGQGLRKSKRRK